MITVEGRGNGRADRPDGSRRAHTFAELRGGRPRRPRRHGHRTGRHRRRLARRRPRRRPRRHRARAGHRRGAHRPRAGVARPRSPSSRRTPSRGGAGRATRAGRCTTGTSGAGTCPDSPTSSGARSSPSRTRPSRSRTAWAGPWRRTPRSSSPPSSTGARAPATGSGRWSCCASIRCPVLVIHGTDDRDRRRCAAQIAAEATGGDLLLVEGGGHCPQARDPIRVNRAMMEFVERVTPPQDRPPRQRPGRAR